MTAEITDAVEDDDREMALKEAELLEQTDNSVRPEDGSQPPQDESPGLENQED